MVSGAHTASGKPLLANDPHLGRGRALGLVPGRAALPHGQRRRARSTSPGFSFSGLPGVIIGHNDRIAWGFTNLGPDVADLYEEKVTGNTYEYDGKQMPLTTTERDDQGRRAATR